MKPFLVKIYTLLEKPLFPLKHMREDGLLYWRERILYNFAIITIYIGFLILIPSVLVSIQSGVNSIAIIDIIVYIYLVYIFTSRKLSFRLRINSLLVLIYLLSSALLLLLGPYGAGIVWLFTVPLIAGIFLGLKPALQALMLNFITLTLMGLVVYFDPYPLFQISDYGFGGFIAVSLNFLVINVLFSVSLGVLLDGLENTMNEEKKLRKILNNEKQIMMKLKEKAEASDKIKTAFLTNISHDLRTPLNAILGFAQLMQKKKLNTETQDRYFSIIMGQGQSLLHLINDIIDVAKLEAGEITVHKEHFNLYELLNEIADFFDEQIKIKKQDQLQLRISMAQNLPSIIYQDPYRLKQILLNLIGNAIKFTHQGHIIVGAQKYDIHSLLFFVEDTGIGIPENKLNIIFERFRQVDESPTKNHGGTGVGLSICKSMVELLGGYIWVDSELNRGTTFYFKLPVF